MSVQNFINRIKQILPSEHILLEEEDRFAHGTDASFYRLTPQVVLKASTSPEVKSIIQIAAEEKSPLTFRTAGTSLSGQAVTDSILVKLGHHFKHIDIQNNGQNISLEPGVIGGIANKKLADYSRKIGPDPASIDSAMIGGILANNASGMCCGTADNSYKTLESMEIIFANGQELNTNSNDSCTEFTKNNPDLINGLKSIREEILNQPDLTKLIKKKFEIKNTTGYGLNSFIDHEDPIDILQHLMIGSEGTLGFIAKVNLRTVVVPKIRACALVVADMQSACSCIPNLKECSMAAVELMDGHSLKNIESQYIPDNIKDEDMALLLEIGAENEDELNLKMTKVKEALSVFNMMPEFTQNLQHIQELWKIRKGLFPIIGARRPTGSTIIIEDICFPIKELAKGVETLQASLKKHGYEDTILFGHALEGNLHFVFAQNFESESEVKRYADFMDELADIVVAKEGSLKAEHGTGRNMAPYVEKEWGAKAYELMKRIKILFDPDNILNPDVIICEDKQQHIKNLKHVPAAHELVDKCIECGFCESVCPSLNLSFSPRQRITALRNLPMHKIKYQFDQTCAGDGLCLSKCPVQINTGDLVREYRQEPAPPSPGTMTNMLKANQLFRSIPGYSFAMDLLSQTGLAPKAYDLLPAAAKPLPEFHEEGEKVLYFPSCINRSMASEGQSINDVIKSLFKKAGFQAIVPHTITRHCCGLPAKSKGQFKESQEYIESLRTEFIKHKNLDVVCENSPCTQQLIENISDRPIFDAVSFFAKHIDRFQIEQKESKSFVFPVCSTKKMNNFSDLLKIAQHCSNEVVSSEINCCGFAGDKGFFQPELNETALQNIKKETEGCSKGYASSRTCEIGLKKHSGIPFESILVLLDNCTN